MAKKQKIKKPWCIYLFGWIPGSVGKVEEESESAAWVRYSERQMYPLSAWEHKYLKRFKTINGAIRKCAELEGISLRDAVEKALSDFPSEREAIEKLRKPIKEI